MPITDKQRSARRKHIGSTDVAALLGKDPWGRNAYDVWLEKVGKIEGKPATEAMKAGTFLEEGILQFAESEIGPIRRNQYRANPKLHLGAHIDGITFKTTLPAEAKKVEYYNPTFKDWGEPNTSEVPADVVIQCHVHMLTMKNKPDVCYVPALIGGRLTMYVVERDGDLIEIIEAKVIEFWTKFVVPRVPPPDIYPDLSTIKQISRVPDKVVEIPTALVTDYEAIKRAQSILKKQEDQALAKIVTEMDDAEAADFGDPSRLFYYKEYERKGYIVKPTKYRSPKIIKRRKELPAP